MKFELLENLDRLCSVRLRLAKWPFYLFGTAFASLGMFMLWNLGEATSLSCSRSVGDRDSGRCILQTKRLWVTKHQEWPLTAISGSKLDRDRLDNWQSYPLVIETRDGNIPVNLVSADADEKEDRANHIKQFLENPQIATVTVGEDSRWLHYSLSILVALPGLFLISIPSVFGSIVCKFTHQPDCIEIERQGRWPTQDTISLDSLKDIRIVEYMSATYNLSFDMTNGKSIKLAPIPLFGETEIKQVYIALSRFFERDFQSQITPVESLPALMPENPQSENIHSKLTEPPSQEL
jgi:hypothetical protein